ncbi:hypothetical protein ATP06_0221405 [Amycolatopsis regifaucium]|uniref:Uncharacterized protein n=1 Tax=Amycolatopsis regifaucium TaxID=546365 RepID=A0ABX3DME0_9PSEU|nr:hypothetical protein ATP06_0221405 [Amycolatopsis regifaucium]
MARPTPNVTSLILKTLDPVNAPVPTCVPFFAPLKPGTRGRVWSRAPRTPTAPGPRNRCPAV